VTNGNFSGLVSKEVVDVYSIGRVGFNAIPESVGIVSVLLRPDSRSWRLTSFLPPSLARNST
jgi:hypothetical protein